MDCIRCGKPNDSGDSLVCPPCLEARENIPEFRALRGEVGMSISAAVRAYAMTVSDLSDADAHRLAKAIDTHLHDAEWLTLDNGLTFDRGYDPSKYPNLVRHLT